LRQEYARGLEIGGVEGGSICRGVLRASQELGVGDDWLDSLRSDRQRQSLDDARRLEHYAGLISVKAPEPPKSLRKPSGRGGGPAPLLVPASGSPFPASGGGSRATKRRRKKAS
jgi:hypothetical protein